MFMQKHSGKNKTRALSFLLALMLSCFAAFGPGAAAQEADGRQVWFYGDVYGDVVYDAMVLSNGNMLLCCNTAKPRDGQVSGIPMSRAWLLCLTPDGSVAWEQFIGEEDMENVISNPIELEDGRIALQYHSSYKQNMTEVGVKYFSLEGELLEEWQTGALVWKMRIPAGQGYLEERGLGNGFFEYSFVSPDGQPLWKLPTEKQASAYGRISVLPQEEGLLLSATDREGELWFQGLSEEPEDISIWKPWLMMVSHEGALLWETDLTEYAGVALGSCTLAQDGGFLVTGRTSTLQTEIPWTGYLMKVGSTGTLEWVQEYAFEPGEGSLGGVTETEQGFVLSYRAKSETRMGILLTDKQGRELWRGLLPYADGWYFDLDQITLEGEAWFYGMVERDGRGFDIMVMKLDTGSLFEAAKGQSKKAPRDGLRRLKGQAPLEPLH